MQSVQIMYRSNSAQNNLKINVPEGLTTSVEVRPSPARPLHTTRCPSSLAEVHLDAREKQPGTSLVRFA
ncbi:hypothetical protein AB1N83_005619 [Pleurotus pulmonarius]